VFHRSLRDSRYVAGGSGYPIKTFYTAWESACAQAADQLSGTLRQLAPNRRRVGIYLGFIEEKALTLFELLDDFIADYKQRGLRDVRITQWRTNNLRGFFKDIPVAGITERKIDLYIKHRLKMGRTRTTINRDLQLLGQALRLAKRRKLIQDLPYIERFPEKGNARKGFFERDELETLVALLPEYNCPQIGGASGILPLYLSSGGAADHQSLPRLAHHPQESRTATAASA
jgi:hypothetical protein